MILMNYAVPFNRQNQAYFYAQGTGGSVGSYEKSMGAKTQIAIDYTGVPGFAISQISFVLNTQTVPPLVISQPVVGNQNNILSFMLSGGFGGVEYTISINCTAPNGTVRSDTLLACITAPYEDCCCSSCGHYPCDCYSCDTITDLKEQVATIVSGASTFGSNYIQYYVSASAPQNANVLDKWYDTTNGLIYDYMSDGVHTFWQPEFGTTGGTISGPVTINNSLTVTGAVDMTLDMGMY
jgi:hypothetical protein